MEEEAVITHTSAIGDLDDNIKEITERISLSFEGEEREYRLQLLAELQEFELGRYNIVNRGINGKWIDYVYEHAKTRGGSGFDKDGKPFTELESYLLNRFPIVVATLERFEIFQEVLKREIRSGHTVASLPCGWMRDLLELNLEGVENVKFVGIDIDQESLDGVAEKARGLGLDDVSLIKADAWNHGCDSEFDILTSNGLNMFVHDRGRRVSLYREFFNALKPGGLLLTSFLTPSPALDSNSCWDMAQLDKDDLLRQKVLFAEILETKWQSYWTEEEMKLQLTEAGFDDFEVIYDKGRIFPTITARKPL